MTFSRIAALAVLAALVLVVVAALLTSGDDDSATSATAATAIDDEATAIAPSAQSPEPEAPPVLRPRPDLIGIDGWLQAEYDSLDDLDGQVYIVEFWTFGCFNCRNVKPHLRAIYDRYQPEGLEIVGVHSPEFDFEKDVEAIEQAALDQNVNWPIALDTNKRSFRSWQQDRRFWPRTYVVDQNGDIRYDHIGEGGYDDLEATVAWLLTNGA